MVEQDRERLVVYFQTSSVSAAHATHCATNCSPCRPLIRAFPGWIRTPDSTQDREGERSRPARLEQVEQHLACRETSGSLQIETNVWVITEDCCNALTHLVGGLRRMGTGVTPVPAGTGVPKTRKLFPARVVLGYLTCKKMHPPRTLT